MKNMFITSITTIVFCLNTPVFAAEQNRQVESFSSIKTQGALDVRVEVGKAQAISIKGEDRFISKVITRVFGDELIISLKNEKNSEHMSNDLIVTVMVPELKKFTMEGAGKTNIKDINAERFELNYEGVGYLELKGSANVFKLHAKGVGMVNAKKLKADYVDANVEGIGAVEVYAKDKLKVSVQGIGSLTYYGNPRSVSKSTEGLGSVKAGE